MKTAIYSFLFLLSFASCINKNSEQWWPQFRGPNGSGVANENAKPPNNFEDKYLKWKTDLPVGFSSPVIWDNKIFLTGSFEDKKELLTICLNRKDGKILWQKSLSPDTLEKYTSISNPAVNTAVTDGERVIIYFPSCGLICYNSEGEEQWKYQKRATRFPYGNGTSPVISGNKLVFLNDEGKERYLLALDKTNGKEIWKTAFQVDTLYGYQGGHATPCIYKDNIIVHRVGEVTAYSIIDGSFLWDYKILTEAAGSPVMAGNKVVVNCWFNMGDDAERQKWLNYDELLQKYDSNKNGEISKTELPDDFMLFSRPEIRDIKRANIPFKEYFEDIDENGNHEINRKEWDAVTDEMKPYIKSSGLISINPEARGAITDSAILWSVTKNTAEVPSPIYYLDRVYMIKDGGFITCINPGTGKIIYQTRLGNPGAYFATPVAANGLIYIFGYNGKLTIIKAGDELKVVAQHDFKDNIAATPAIIGNSIYIRTKTGLLAYSI
jgi:outer membrane protein assembly factor BamB